MSPDDFDARMRSFEAALDFAAAPGMFLIARLDGRGFTRLTKQVYKFENPFDAIFRDHMVATAKHLMTAGFRVVYAYTQSDEISLLFNPDDNLFDRKLRKLCSVLAGEASACFSLALGGIASFDCRILQLPSMELVVDYFRWRQGDASRNALNAHCYWCLRKAGKSAASAESLLKGRSTVEKIQLLMEHGIRFDELPMWQKRGGGLYAERVEKQAVNRKTGSPTKVVRREIRVDLELPAKASYDGFLQTIVVAEP